MPLDYLMQFFAVRLSRQYKSQALDGGEHTSQAVAFAVPSHSHSQLPSSSIVFTSLSALTVYHIHQLLNLAAMDSFTDILSAFSSSASASVKPSIVSHKTEEEVQVPVEEESNISNSTYCVVA
ncbi:uncharacterized protein STEHIDRAFT_172410 [Stereum hirsutum FP-91666 SS1]|uniref:uncharacterized protein n=1 Tax=Stereum hirsutum (strain FP-91666) TaxID=721885 RepID=UPI000444A4EB|nr:uncharacterized protein STEHIDRAFT_172410 [Stereum hirsutum FP-91666 SS1]EIM80673.1 hypothetical protein STEHIDRAFT_172410 [Stereum hirsutum FP-91666 SS1]